MMSRRWMFIAILAVLLTGVVWYFGQSSRGHAYDLDLDVEQRYLSGRQQVDALEFFEKGGIYESIESSETDKNYVLPLVKRLKEEFQLSPIVALDSPGRAFGLFLRVPADPITRQKLGTLFQEADDAFPGLMTDNWGKRWVSLDWLEGMELEALKASQALEIIQAEHQRIRKNP